SRNAILSSRLVSALISRGRPPFVAVEGSRRRVAALRRRDMLAVYDDATAVGVPQAECAERARLLVVVGARLQPVSQRKALAHGHGRIRLQRLGRTVPFAESQTPNHFGTGDSRALLTPFATFTGPGGNSINT